MVRYVYIHSECSGVVAPKVAHNKGRAVKPEFRLCRIVFAPIEELLCRIVFAPI